MVSMASYWEKSFHSVFDGYNIHSRRCRIQPLRSIDVYDECYEFQNNYRNRWRPALCNMDQSIASFICTISSKSFMLYLERVNKLGNGKGMTKTRMIEVWMCLPGDRVCWGNMKEGDTHRHKQNANSSKGCHYDGLRTRWTKKQILWTTPKHNFPRITYRPALVGYTWYRSHPENLFMLCY